MLESFSNFSLSFYSLSFFTRKCQVLDKNVSSLSILHRFTFLMNEVCLKSNGTVHAARTTFIAEKKKHCSL